MAEMQGDRAAFGTCSADHRNGRDVASHFSVPQSRRAIADSGQLSDCRQRLRGSAVTGEDHGQAARIGASEPALGGDAEVLDHVLGSSDSRGVAGLIMLQEVQVQMAGLWSPPSAKRREKLFGRVLRYRNMNELHRPPHEIGDAVHQFHENAGVIEDQERLVAGRPVTKMKSQIHIMGDGRAQSCKR